MMEECIYSKRYAGEWIDMGIKHPALTMHRRRDIILTDDDFIKLAIELSEKNRIGLDLFERTDHLRADLFLHTEILDEDSSESWDGLMAASHLFGLVVRNADPQTVVVSFVRIKEKYLAEE